MALKSELGFGMMRLPVLNGNPTDFDYEHLNRMVDTYLEAGFNYFDTSYKIEGYFQQQLDRLGVEYIDYYLLHNFQTRWYDGYEGNGGVIQSEHLIEHALKWKEEGKIRHLGFSFHSSAKLLDRILTEHPEFEFVQIAANYLDWNSQLVQAGPCYDVIRQHGKKVIVMEPVKGGGLAKVPTAVETVLKECEPDASVASWGRYGHFGVFKSDLNP